MKSLGEVLTLSAEFLKTKQSPRPRRIAEELIGDVLQIKRLDLYLHFDRPMEEEELRQIRALLKRASLGEPVEYILGQHSFYNCQLNLNPHVLIPRPETEILADQICSLLKKETLEGKTAWDLCTGSGCLGIAIKKRFPQLHVVLADISKNALAVASENAKRNGMEVEVLEGDLLAPFSGRKADLIFCNPPYISLNEYFNLDPSVRDFEPKGALVGGEDGLDFYRRLNKELPRHLERGAKLFLEIGALQAEPLLSLFSEPHWKNVRVERDWAGHNRFFFLEIE